ncbi:hypothetical protein [Desulfonatronovibrio magnus]|uniref:hypothetical protein n=1 Tax=Desulfonatronovibrio magnus TaxID=698827 RepID=UPI0005EBA072|nr:hypothetical protein [Desulfonatronovibrio magnus]
MPDPSIVSNDCIAGLYYGLEKGSSIIYDDLLGEFAYCSQTGVWERVVTRNFYNLERAMMPTILVLQPSA